MTQKAASYDKWQRTPTYSNAYITTSILNINFKTSTFISRIYHTVVGVMIRYSCLTYSIQAFQLFFFWVAIRLLFN